MEQRESKTHRQLLQQLDLVHFEPTSPGMPFWLPAGTVVLRELRELWLRRHRARGYLEMSGPQLSDRSTFDLSGHAQHFGEGMFWAGRFGLKPTNCPGALQIFASRRRSYRELPMRLYCEDLLHRNEQSGALNGLLRVQEFRQDDAHVFVAESGVVEELESIFRFAQDLYGLFGLAFRLRLGLSPADRMGDDDLWARATATLREALDRFAGPDGYEVMAGEGAFYGPKIDILMTDSLRREWQTGTLQVDLQLPARFACLYIDHDGVEKVPVLIHRAIAGSFERFLGILLEHTDGHLPPPLAPVQVLVIPVGPRHADGANLIADRLRRAGARVEVGDGRRTVSALVREAAERRIPRLGVVGDRELEAGVLAVRRPHGGSELVSPPALAREVRAWGTMPANGDAVPDCDADV
jgi:threonyl-tRNA synthetase